MKALRNKRTQRIIRDSKFAKSNQADTPANNLNLAELWAKVMKKESKSIEKYDSYSQIDSVQLSREYRI